MDSGTISWSWAASKTTRHSARGETNCGTPLRTLEIPNALIAWVGRKRWIKQRLTSLHAFAFMSIQVSPCYFGGAPPSLHIRRLRNTFCIYSRSQRSQDIICLPANANDPEAFVGSTHVSWASSFSDGSIQPLSDGLVPESAELALGASPFHSAPNFSLLERQPVFRQLDPSRPRPPSTLSLSKSPLRQPPSPQASALADKTTTKHRRCLM